MISIELTDTKDFMNKLLRTEIFDNFLLQEAFITKAASYVIDGHLQKGFYSSTELEENGIAGYSILPFRMLRTNCFDLIKGRQTPSSFKFVFLLSPENMEHTLSSLHFRSIVCLHSAFTVSDISGFFINIRYQNKLLTLTTGISYNIFSADKTLDSEWDKLVMKFLANNDINFKEL